MQDRWMRTQVFDIAATPQGGSDLNISPKCYEGKRLASLTSSPRYDTGTPKGFYNNKDFEWLYFL